MTSIKSIKKVKYTGTIHNIGVEVDESYTVEGVMVKNCRGIWVEIMTDEKNAPEITGVPSSISSLYGGQPNELIQPKRPIVREGTPAAEYVKKRDSLKKK